MITTTNKIDLPAFFIGSKTVWSSENFQNLLLAKYTGDKKDQEIPVIKASDLQEMRANADIHDLVFKDADAFLEQLAVLIQGQINGEEGKLLNDSSANYFFVQGKDGKFYSVLVRFEPAQRLWRCGAYLQEELKMPNVRIFYPE